MRKIFVNLLDMDGTLVPQIFNAKELKNDNKNCLKHEFLEKLRELQPLRWVQEKLDEPIHFKCELAELTSDGITVINIVVTGRLPEMNNVTEIWFKKNYPWVDFPHSIINIPWDDTLLPEAAKRDYETRKTSALAGIIRLWQQLAWCKGEIEIRVYEDDLEVIERLAELAKKQVLKYLPRVVKGGLLS